MQIFCRKIWFCSERIFELLSAFELRSGFMAALSTDLSTPCREKNSHLSAPPPNLLFVISLILGDMWPDPTSVSWRVGERTWERDCSETTQILTKTTLWLYLGMSMLTKICLTLENRGLIKSWSLPISTAPTFYISNFQTPELQMCNLKLLLVPTVLLTVCQRELTVVSQFRSTLLVSSYIDVYGEAAQ